MMRSWALFAVLLLPVASAAPVNLYAHTSTFQDFPLNTQEPQPSYAALPLGGSWMSGCVQDPLDAQGLTDRSYHTWYAVSSPAKVDYDIDDNGRPRIHMERGISGDVILNGDSMTLHWYLAFEQSASGAIPVAPDIIVRGTVREGDDVSVGSAALNAGRLIASGQSDPVTLSPMVDHPQVSHHMVGEQHVFGFHITLPIEERVIKADEAFNLRVDAFMDNPLCNDPNTAGGGDYLNPFKLEVHESQGLWNHLEIDVEDPVSIELFHAQTVGRDIVLHLAANSVFGSYDIAPGPWIVFDDEAPAQRVSATTPNGMNDHTRDTTEAYVWDWRNTTPGVYPFTLRVENLQGTADATLRGELHVDTEGPRICLDGACLVESTSKESSTPGVPAATVLLALAAIAMARRK